MCYFCDVHNDFNVFNVKCIFVYNKHIYENVTNQKSKQQDCEAQGLTEEAFTPSGDRGRGRPSELLGLL